jgi:hypothetical protein
MDLGASTVILGNCAGSDAVALHGHNRDPDVAINNDFFAGATTGPAWWTLLGVLGEFFSFNSYTQIIGRADNRCHVGRKNRQSFTHATWLGCAAFPF